MARFPPTGLAGRLTVVILVSALVAAMAASIDLADQQRADRVAAAAGHLALADAEAKRQQAFLDGIVQLMRGRGPEIATPQCESILRHLWSSLPGVLAVAYRGASGSTCDVGPIPQEPLVQATVDRVLSSRDAVLGEFNKEPAPGDCRSGSPS